MPTSDEVRFGPYRLDRTGRLRNVDQPVPLQPKPLAVLAYLAARPGMVVSRDEIIRTVWAGTYVTKAVLKVAVRAIREALGDDAGAPRYIETVGREGYRFIAGDDAARRPSRESAASAEPGMVGRERELGVLHAHLGRALTARRAVTFVTGEAGIGKTTLIDAFVAEVARDGRAWIGRGQCLEQYGVGEAYLPVLEALSGLLRAEAGATLAAVLRQHAPTWVPLLPAIASSGAARAPDGAAVAPRPARMLRELADALEVFTSEHGLLLALEDLQWSDPSTIDLLARIARRRDPARLMVIGTFRPADVIVHDHPLRTVEHELLASGLCEALSLELLSLADVTAYVDARLRLPGDETRRIAALVYERTEGNALFMVSVVNDLVARRLLVFQDGRWHVEGSIDRATKWIPVGLQQLIGRQMRRLTPAAHRVLEAASVAGDDFAIASVAAALGDDPDTIEDVCEGLASHGHLIDEAGVAEWPDGSITGRYRFRHALYRRALYDAIGDARRVRLHRQIGLREEVGFAGRVAERAAHLAMHFTQGRDHGRAVEYHALAGTIALDRHAAHEAVSHFTAALDALAHEPDGPARRERELRLVVANATLLMAVRGHVAPETERGFARARELCELLPESPQRYPVLRGLVSHHQVGARLDEAHELGLLLLRHADEHPDDRTLRVQAHYGHGATLFHMGRLAEARLHFEAALRDYDPAAHREHVTVYGSYDPGVACMVWLSWTLAFGGELEQAALYETEGLALARRLADAFTLAFACFGTGMTQQIFGAWDRAERLAAEALAIAEEHGFPYVRGMALINRGWDLVMLGKAPQGIELLREGVAQVDATGARLVRSSYIALLGAADAVEGDFPAALRRFDDALAEIDATGERFYEAGILAAKAQVLARAPSASTARAGEIEACLRRALDVATAQGAHLLALRAAVGLARHRRAVGRDADGLALLRPAYARVAQTRIAAPEIVGARELLGPAR